MNKTSSSSCVSPDFKNKEQKTSYVCDLHDYSLRKRELLLKEILDNDESQKELILS